MQDNQYSSSSFQTCVERFEKVKERALESAKENDYQVYRREETLLSFHSEDIATFALSHTKETIDLTESLEDLLSNSTYDLLGTSKQGSGFWNLDVDISIHYQSKNILVFRADGIPDDNNPEVEDFMVVLFQTTEGVASFLMPQWDEQYSDILFMLGLEEQTDFPSKIINSFSMWIGE